MAIRNIRATYPRDLPRNLPRNLALARPDGGRGPVATGPPKMARSGDRTWRTGEPKGARAGYDCVGVKNRKMAPRGWFASAHNRPPCASMIERQIESPIPKPVGLVV